MMCLGSIAYIVTTQMNAFIYSYHICHNMSQDDIPADYTVLEVKMSTRRLLGL